MIKNLTPHDVRVVNDRNVLIWLYEKSDKPARCSVERIRTGMINYIPLNQLSFGEVQNLPKPKRGTFFIVSHMVAEAAKRDDLLVPDDLVRDETGAVIGCRGFSKK